MRPPSMKFPCFPDAGRSMIGAQPSIAPLFETAFMTASQSPETAPAAAFTPWLAEASILVVDDEPGMRNFLVRMLAARCKHVEEAGDTATASRLLDASHFDLIILDNIMPGKSGLDWLQDLRDGGFFNEVILITAFADLDTAIQALRAGAADFVLKPFRTRQILNSISRCLDRARLRRENFVLKRELRSLPSSDRTGWKLLGDSPGIRHARDIITRVAALPSTVLITGESGTGKEVTARALHNMSPRADKPFVPLNCAAIAPDIIESELFGHLRGAFTGAVSSREGLFFYAQGGTLFLDEAGELPPAMQSKLLRVIEDKRVRPVGAEREVPVDVRLVAATNGDLAQAVAKGKFRQDLYYRLNVVQIHLPPLRERVQDVEPLARMFVQQISAQLGVPPLELDAGILADLAAYSWPGNVRELRNVIERSLILGGFPHDLLGIHGPRETKSEALEEVGKSHMLSVLEATGGNRAEAARRLGISRKTLDRKCAAWNV
jgi:DNA-binding NtrC family response regulator